MALLRMGVLPGSEGSLESAATEPPEADPGFLLSYSGFIRLCA